jgi:cell cycle arrest protein BUB3
MSFTAFILNFFLCSYHTIRHNTSTFASAGSDGTVSIWDHKVKKRLRQCPKYASAIPSIASNCDGTRLAVGVSYTWDEGEEGLKKEGGTTRAVWMRKIGDEVEVREPLFDCLCMY